MNPSRSLCPTCGGELRFDGTGGSMCPQCARGRERPSTRKIRLLRPEPGPGSPAKPAAPSPFAEIEAENLPPPVPPPRPQPTRPGKKVRPFGPRDEADLIEYHAELDRQRLVDSTLTWFDRPELPYRLLRFGLKLLAVVAGSWILKSPIFFLIGLAVLVAADFALPFALEFLRETATEVGERVVVKNKLSVVARVDYEGKHLGLGSEHVGPGTSIELRLERGATVTVIDERTNAVLHVDSIVRGKTIVVGGDSREE